MITRPATDHDRYADARKLAKREGWLRYLRSWQDVEAATQGYRYDKSRADHVVKFFSFFRHTKGRWSGQQFCLQPWQEHDLVRPLFGWVNDAGSRRFRRAYVEIPKKNGKTTLAAVIALYLLLADNEPGAEVYSAATDTNQAGLVYLEAERMVTRSPFASMVTPYVSTKRIITHDGSFYRVLSSDAGRSEGLNIHGLIFDELHAQGKREFFESLLYGGASRTQPLLLSITTAGYNRNSICYEEHTLAKKVLAGETPNPNYFGYISAAEPNDNWQSPRTWKKTNPSYGITVFESDFKQQCEEAMSSPAKQNAFRRYRLNQWTEQEERWLDMDAWRAVGSGYKADDLFGLECYAGLDLSTTTDYSALVLLFPPTEPGGRYRILPYFWIPREKMEDRTQTDQVPVTQWERDGYVRATTGNVVDYREIVADISRLGSMFRFKQLAFDRWGSQPLVNELMGMGLDVYQFGQGFRSMSAPTKELMTMVLGKSIEHNNNPVLNWMASNLVVTSDPAGNLKPDKRKSTERIDGMVALVMALSMATAIRDTQAVGDVYFG